MGTEAIIMLALRLGLETFEAWKRAGVNKINVDGQDVDLTALDVQSVSDRLKAGGVTEDDIRKALEKNDEEQP